MTDDRVETKHPSFGLIRFSRIHGGENVLFGSSIRHSNMIEMTIKRGTKVRNLHGDWYYGRQELICVAMSPAQFADAITCMNMGDGVPCTIREVDGESQGPCPDTNMREVFEEEFKADVRKVFKDMHDLSAKVSTIFEQKTINKAEREQIRSDLRMLMQHIECNMPFVQSRFNEAVEDTIHEAKMEIEAFHSNKIASLGIEALKEEVRNKAIEIPVVPNLK
jgi:hypothetical protein